MVIISIKRKFMNDLYKDNPIALEPGAWSFYKKYKKIDNK